MHLVPTWLLNEVARTQPLKTSWARQVFRMSGAERLAFLEREAELMEQQGYPAVVVWCYQMVAPLLAEDEAFSEYVRSGGEISSEGMFRARTLDEAVALAQTLRALNEGRTEMLIRLLRRMQQHGDV